MRPGSSKFSRPTTTKKPNKVSLSNIQTDNLHNIVEELIAKQKQCQRLGKYVEAETFKRKIKTLKQQVEKGELMEMKERHERQKKQIEQAHLEEFNCFNIEWDEKIANLQAEIVNMENQLTNKHQLQINNIQEEILDERPSKFKQSGQLLNLRKIQQELAKQENYMQAQQVQKRAQKLEKAELQKWKANQSSKCKNSLYVLKQKQEAEMKVLRQRIELIIEEKHRQRMQEQQKLMLKYQNIIKQLECQQKQELMRFQKNIKLGGIQKKTKIGMFSVSKIG